MPNCLSFLATKLKRKEKIMDRVSFPYCYCDVAKYLGVGECEAICPHKFNADGSSKHFTIIPFDVCKKGGDKK
jgi:hypothetical protein